MGTSIAVFRKGVALTQIAAIGELIEDGKVIKVSKQAGTSKQISQSTLIIAADGRFNQQTASIALKRVCEKIIKDRNWKRKIGKPIVQFSIFAY